MPSRKKGPDVPVTLYEAGCLVYFHNRVDRKDKKDFWRHVFAWRPPSVTAEDPLPHPSVILRKVEPKDMRYDVYDRFCDQDGDIVHKNGDWKSPTGIRTEGETVNADPWDSALGKRPGDAD